MVRIEDDYTNSEALTSDNSDYSTFNALQIRLNTQVLLKEIQFFLEGKKEVIKTDKEGMPSITVEKISIPKANDTGVFSIMAWLKTSINPQVVQGNFDGFQELSNYIADYRLNLSLYVMKNLNRWDILVDEYEGIIDMIMNLVKPFFSRLVNDGERKSFFKTIEHKETNNNIQKSKPSLGFRVRGL